LRACAASLGIKPGVLIHAARIALTGRAVSPGLFETLVLIGRHEGVNRLRALAQFLER
jgi:glutamyl-tRNA synthetase